MNRPGSGSSSRIRRGEPADALPGDRVGAVEVLVDALHEVGGAQLRQHVVTRVVVGLGLGLARLEQPDQLGRALRWPAGAVPGSGTHPSTTGSAGSSSDSDGQRRDHPVAVLAAVRTARDEDRPARDPDALQLGRPTERVRRERVVGSEQVG